MAADRTERPTPRRLRDARRKGQIARSRDLEQGAQLVVVLAVIGWGGPLMVRALGHALRIGIERVGEGALRSVQPGELAAFALSTAGTLGLLTMPLGGAAMVAAVAAAAAQGGWNVAPEALKPDWTRLSPRTGLQRLLPSRAGVDVLKTALVVAVFGWITAGVVRAALEGAVTLGRIPPVHAAVLGWAQVERLLRQAAAAMVALGAADYLVQRWRVGKSLRMTKQEVRDDLRLTEGSPEIKARLRRLQRQLVRKRMLAAVPKATVVVTNPTHFAVALEYHRERMMAPRVVAKGQGWLAERIRAIARDHGVPIVENVPLAQALYKGVEVGESIPGELFGAVAEVLAYLIRLKQLVL